MKSLPLKQCCKEPIECLSELVHWHLAKVKCCSQDWDNCQLRTKINYLSWPNYFFSFFLGKFKILKIFWFHNLHWFILWTYGCKSYKYLQFSQQIIFLPVWKIENAIMNKLVSKYIFRHVVSCLWLL